MVGQAGLVGQVGQVQGRPQLPSWVPGTSPLLGIIDDDDDEAVVDQCY